ncbi:MAG: AMP-binding protein [Candidatus Binataceae bacterium]|jgi:acyl-CoA synthetase (AMP-forming)/AMP-acid ligase II
MRPIDYFDRGVLLDPNQVALVSLGQSFTYRQLDEQSRRIAAAMSNRGLAGVPHVAILSRNHPLAVAALIGAFRAGAVWVPINPMNALETNIEVMRYADVEWLFYNSNCADQLPRIREAVPTLKQIVCLDRDDGAVKSLERFMATEGIGAVPEFPSDPNRLCTILPTGGTTGPSKAVMHTFLVWHTLFALGVCHWHTEERPVFLGVTPMTHAAGIFGYMHFFRGGTMVLDDGFDPRRWCDAIERYRVTHTFLPPTALYALLAYPDVRRFDYSSLRYFCIAAAPVSADKLKEAVDVFGPCMCEVFGQAEAPALLTALSPAEVAAAAAPGGNAKLLSSCGRPTLLAKLAIMDDRGNLLPTGQPGEIVAQSFLNIPGYYKKPEATAELQAFGWHHTGDIGYFDDAGYLYIVDRKKDMIITGGFNVFSAEVERAVLSVEAVKDCAVVGAPDEKWGEAVTAVVELKPGSRASESEIVAQCKERLGSVKAPKTVEFWDVLPRTSVGKVDKKAIREKFWTGRSRQVN